MGQVRIVASPTCAAVEVVAAAGIHNVAAVRMVVLEGSTPGTLEGVGRRVPHTPVESTCRRCRGRGPAAAATAVAVRALACQHCRQAGRIMRRLRWTRYSRPLRVRLGIAKLHVCAVEANIPVIIHRLVMYL